MCRFVARAVAIGALVASVKVCPASDVVWTPLPAYPTPIANNAVTSVDNGDGTFTLYSFMGIRNPADQETITPASYRLLYPGGDWQQIADAPLLNGRAKIGASAATVAGRVYLIGGYTVRGFSEVTEHRLFRYDAPGDQYIELARVPVEVDDTVVGVFQDRYLYLVSGWHGPLNRNVPNTQVYDTQTDAWVQATPIPAPLPGLFGHSGTIIGDRIIYMDGVRSTDFRISNRVFVGRIDPNGNGDIAEIAWSEIPAHPGSPTYRAAASQGGFDGSMLLVGGSDNPYNFDGNGFNGRPAFPLDQILRHDPIIGDWSVLSEAGEHTPTMDHRALVRIGRNWATVGGMTGPEVAIDRVYLMTFRDDITPGDTNCDGPVNALDIEPFITALFDPPRYLADFPGCNIFSADINADGSIDALDIEPFLGLLFP